MANIAKEVWELLISNGIWLYLNISPVSWTNLQTRNLPAGWTFRNEYWIMSFKICVSSEGPQKKIFTLSVSSIAQVCYVESRSIEHSNRCAVSTREPERLLRFPRVLPDPSCVKQDITQTSAFSNLNNTILANPAMLYQGFEYASSQTSVWDVQVVINFIKSQMESTDTLPERKFSLKLCMVLAFTTASKTSCLYDFDIIY